MIGKHQFFMSETADWERNSTETNVSIFVFLNSNCVCLHIFSSVAPEPHTFSKVNVTNISLAYAIALTVYLLTTGWTVRGSKPQLSITVPRPQQPSVQWVPVFFPGNTSARVWPQPPTHPQSSAEVMKHRGCAAMPPLGFHGLL